MPWVREIFMADVPSVDLPKYQDKLKLFYMKTLDFMESNNLQISKENILKNADKIKHWDIAAVAAEPIIETGKDENIVVTNKNEIEEKKPCACIRISAIETELFKWKRYGLFAFIVLLILIFSIRNSS